MSAAIVPAPCQVLSAVVVEYEYMKKAVNIFLSYSFFSLVSVFRFWISEPSFALLRFLSPYSSISVNSSAPLFFFLFFVSVTLLLPQVCFSLSLPRCIVYIFVIARVLDLGLEFNRSGGDGYLSCQSISFLYLPSLTTHCPHCHSSLRLRLCLTGVLNDLSTHLRELMFTAFTLRRACCL